MDTDRAIIQEAFQVLIEHLEPSKVMRFLAICNPENGDYLQLKDKLFTDYYPFIWEHPVSANRLPQQKRFLLTQR